MLKVNNLKKVYKLSKKQMALGKTKEKYKNAVNGIDFVASPGQVFGLLGPNGAGKTTTLRCLSTLIKPTEGEIFVDNINALKNEEEVRKKICFLTNELKLDEFFTPNYTINYFGSLYGLSKEEIERKKEILFKRFEIDSYQETKIGELSTGMKQKLSIAVSLIHDPEIIIFDEPTNGLDIITAKSVTDYLIELKNKGKTVIISTHIMSVAQQLCDEIAILIDGKIKINGTLNQILEKTGKENLEDAFFELYVQSKGGKRKQ